MTSVSHREEGYRRCCFFRRFRVAHSNDDYEEGITILDKLIRAPGDRPTENASLLATLFAQARWEFCGKPEYLEEAIYRMRTLLGETSLENSRHSTFTHGLAFLQASRWTRFDDPDTVPVFPDSFLG